MNRRDMLRHTAMLVGFAAGGSVSQAILAGTPFNRGIAATVFNIDQQKNISVLSEMIIPTTDTPGAIKAGVPDFIATIVGEWYNDKERAVFFKGLKALDQYCQAEQQVPFHSACEDTRTEALKQQEQITTDYKANNPGAAGHPLAGKADDNLPFFGKVKELVVVGYYNSEVGAKEELAYMPMPGYFDGDYEYAKVGKRWSS